MPSDDIRQDRLTLLDRLRGLQELAMAAKELEALQCPTARTAVITIRRGVINAMAHTSSPSLVLTLMSAHEALQTTMRPDWLLFDQMLVDAVTYAGRRN